MKFFTAAVAFSTVLAFASAAAVKRHEHPVYALTAIHSGNQSVHQHPIKVNATGFWTIGGEHDLEVSFDGNRLKSVDKVSHGHVEVDKQSIRVIAKNHATHGFGLKKAKDSKDRMMTFDGKTHFIACPGANNTFGIKVNTTKSAACSGGVSVGLLVTEIKKKK